MKLLLLAIALLGSAIACGVLDRGPAFPLLLAGLVCLAIRAALGFGEHAPGFWRFGESGRPGSDR